MVMKNKLLSSPTYGLNTLTTYQESPLYSYGAKLMNCNWAFHYDDVDSYYGKDSTHWFRSVDCLGCFCHEGKLIKSGYCESQIASLGDSVKLPD